MTVQLDFNTNFTAFLGNTEYGDHIKVITDSEVIVCSAMLLAQHSSVLRESIKEDEELFLTDNKHVRDCLIVLYGGAVQLTDTNFQDILKFMVTFDVTAARGSVLEWMSRDRWNLDNVSLLINGAMVASKVFDKRSQELTSSKESFREEIYKPVRLFFKEHIVRLIRRDSADFRYWTFDSVMEHLISGVEDRKELLALLLHPDLIPDYIPWIQRLVDHSNYSLFLDSLDKPDISTKMSLCSRAQFENMFEKIEDFEHMTLKEYKQLNRYKMKMHEKIAVLQSLRFMKQGGSLYSCWKVLDADGLSVLSEAFTDKSDQFCVVECLLSWINANKSSCDMDVVGQILSRAIFHLSRGSQNISLRSYLTDYVKKALIKLTQPSQYRSISVIPQDRYTLSVMLNQHEFGDKIVLRFSGDFKNETKTGDSTPFLSPVSTGASGPKTDRACLKITVKLSKDKVPKVSCNDVISNCRLYVYAWKCGGNTTTRVPLYSDPDEAFKTIEMYQKLSEDGFLEGSKGDNRRGDFGACIRFAVVGVGV